MTNATEPGQEFSVGDREAFAERVAQTYDPLELIQLLVAMGLRPSDLALALSVHPRTIRAWLEPGDRDPDRYRDAILSLKAVVLFLLRRGLLSPPNVAGWLVEPNEDLGFKRPLAVLAEGRLDDVLDASATFVRPPADTSAEVADVDPAVAAGAVQHGGGDAG
jgi:hypothetical protein